MPIQSEQKLRVDLLYPVEIGKGSPPADPKDPAYYWHLLAEGDSWFSMGGIPSSNLLNDLMLPKWARILNVAAPGDTIKKMSDIAENAVFKKYVATTNFNYAFHGLLLSAGGNDLIDAAGSLVVQKPLEGKPGDDPESYVNKKALDDLMADIVAQVGIVHALWNSKTSLSADRPIFMHTYDYVTPRNAAALFLGGAKLAGPWVYPAFVNSGIPIQLQQRIVDYLFDTLADTLLSLDAASKSAHALKNVHVVDTRDTLVRANPTEMGNSNDWLNEIHPNSGGYRKIGARLSERIAAVLS